MCCIRSNTSLLAQNAVHDLADVQFLRGLSNLRILWLSVRRRHTLALFHSLLLMAQENPCAETPNYREIVLQNLPFLSKLDNAGDASSVILIALTSTWHCCVHKM
jgi:hypothetical protein